MKKHQYYISYFGLLDVEEGGQTYGHEIMGFGDESSHDLTAENVAHAHNYLLQNKGLKNVIILAFNPIFTDEQVV